MKKEFKNRIIILVLSIFFLNSFTVNAFSISEFLDNFRKIEKNDTNETKINEVEKKQNNIYDTFDNEQKEVYEVIEDLYESFINVEIDNVDDFVDYKLPRKYINNTKEFFDDYDGSKELCSNIFKNLQYEIDSMKYAGNDIVANIKFNIFDIEEVVKKSAPEIIIKNGIDLIANKFTNKNLFSVLEIVDDTINKENFENIDFNYNFTFEKFDDDWKVSNVDEIAKDISTYVDDIIKKYKP